MKQAPVVVLTRETHDNEALKALLTASMIQVIDYPCISTAIDYYHGEALAEGLELDDHTVVAFTSKRGVEGMRYVVPELNELEVTLAAVGDRTAERINAVFGRPADIVAETQTGVGLAELIRRRVHPAGRLLHARGDKANPLFKQILEQNGFTVVERIVYRTFCPSPPKLPPDVRGIVVLASPSTADCFFTANRKMNPTALDDRFYFVTIGPVTEEFVRTRGVGRVYTARKPSRHELFQLINQILMEGEFN